MDTLAQLYKRSVDTIRPEHLSHIVGEGNYSMIHLVDGSKVLFGKTLKVFEIQYPYLIRVNKSLVANATSITDWERIDRITMRIEVLGIRYWVPRRRIGKVIEQLTQVCTAH